MKIALIISLLSLSLSACAERIQDEITNNNPEINAATQPKALDFDASCIGSEQKPKGQLTSRFGHLEDLPNNYQIISYGIDLDELVLRNSIFYVLQKYVAEVEEGREINITGFDGLMSQIVMNNYAWAKGTKNLGGQLYPRATIEEYVFSSEDCARVGVHYLHWANTLGPWPTLEKAPSVVFQNGHSVYYVFGGGEYMRGHLSAIEAALSEH